jgi:hypothetical protein
VVLNINVLCSLMQHPIFSKINSTLIVIK